jgi:hypothetical protein
LTKRRYPFVEAYVTQSPEDGGLYWLWQESKLVYIGLASGKTTLRARLCDHFYGRTSPGGGEATHYSWQLLPRGQLDNPSSRA